MKKLLVITALFIVAMLASCGSDTTSPTGPGSLRVLVLSADRGVLAGAKVVSNTQPGGQVKLTGITGSDGTVLFQGVVAGAYSLYASVANYQQQDFAITVRPGVTVSINITLLRTIPPSSTASLLPSALPPSSSPPTTATAPRT